MNDRSQRTYLTVYSFYFAFYIYNTYNTATTSTTYYLRCDALKIHLPLRDRHAEMKMKISIFRTRDSIMLLNNAIVTSIKIENSNSKFEFTLHYTMQRKTRGPPPMTPYLIYISNLQHLPQPPPTSNHSLT